MEIDNPDLLEFSNDTKEETVEVSSLEDSNIENTEKKKGVRRKRNPNTKYIYMCSQCSKGFNQVSNLTQHVENVHGNKYDQICPICGKKCTKSYIKR